MPATTLNLQTHGRWYTCIGKGQDRGRGPAPFKEWRGWPSFTRLYGVRSAGTRLFSVYGPREDSKKQYANMVSQSLRQMCRGEMPVIYGDGGQTRDFIHVYDVVRALRLVSDYQGILNVGTGRAYSFNEVIRMINAQLGTDIKLKYIETPIKNYVRDTLADVNKSREILGF
ncbi:MAG: NAD-dependent epimerase/dehydratase family protein, partial [Methanothrix sp.]